LATELQDQDGACLRLADQLGDGPLVLVFLRHFG
jgi:peroxiredoxin